MLEVVMGAMASTLTRMATALKSPRIAVDYALYRAGLLTASTAFGGRLRGSTYSELRTVRNLALSDGELSIINMIPKTGHIFDVGAHVGVWTVPLALGRPAATVHAFEASPGTFLQLQRNVADNHLSNARLNNVAVFDREGTITFQQPENASVFGRIASPVNSDGRYSFAAEITARCTALATYCDQNDIRTIEFLKVDVEGAELHVLSGLLPLLKDQRLRLAWIELDANNQIVEDNLSKIANLTDSCGYKFFRLSDPTVPVDVRRHHESNMLLKPSTD
jgi:FkbM family methyltransferase